MTGEQVEILISWAAASTAISIIAVGWIRGTLWPLEDLDDRPEPQRKADESHARRQCAPRPRLGIEVSPIRPPASANPGEWMTTEAIQRVHHHRQLVDERIVDVIHGGRQ